MPLKNLENGGIVPYETSHEIVNDALSLLIQIKTDEDIEGWGEINLVLKPSTMKKIIEDDIGESVMDEDPTNIRKIVEKSAFDVSGQYFSAPALISGIEVACWDIKGKHLGESVSNLLGGSLKESVDISYCLGITDPEFAAEKAKKIMEDGYNTLKTKGGNDIISDADRIKKIREEVGPDLNIRIDQNQALNAAETVRFLQKVEDYNLQYVEQPIRITSFGDLASLRNRTKTPIAVNEDCYIKANAFLAVKKDSIDAAVVDYEPLGGLLKLEEFGGMAEQANLPLAHHCGFDMGIKTAAIVHGTSTIPGFVYAMDSTYYAHKDDIIKERLSIEEGCYKVPSKPGLGIEVDMTKIREYMIE
ncbi:hypothetical protein AKJ41_05750 [candidate division MSBL1 archaeon SCGC-AAA259O05]|uniref:Mandelate racemase/muconate lactonizing enzyme C-terminal domain-containing protein n=1 Tax=candidate division MSBL1 archaeon SCGC-AAA259O05 TaxID=1698271 RepID=A0A133UYG5_9EURY|nr:hypothetical protein AKJ41_05750 [candidate division MSBL1 archaeon SCGC-AAA259O05]